jgi:hypothetical protein
MADKLLYDLPHAPKNRLDVLTEYCKHADAEEETGDPDKIRRFIVKAITPLFTGEPNAKRYRIALDQFAGIPKKLKAEGKSLEGQPPISELIMNAAHAHLSEESLLRSPEESYERKLYDERKRLNGPNGRSEAVSQWQSLRKEEESNQITAK